jgi:uncharacterized membrane protein YfcA
MRINIPQTSEYSFVMPPWETVALMSAVIALAFIVKGITGLGEGFVMMSILLLFFDITYLQPVTLLLVLFADAYFLFRLPKKYNWRTIGTVLPAAIIGIAAGTYLLQSLDPKLIERIFAVCVLAYALKIFFRSHNQVSKHESSIAVGSFAGATSGIMDALFGAGGVPVIMYFRHLGLDKTEFRAMGVMIFFLYHLIRVPLYAYAGLFTMETVTMSFLLVPSLVFGSWAGMKLFHRVSEVLFTRIIGVLLFLVGLSLLV